MAARVHAVITGLGVLLMLLAGGLGARYLLSSEPTGTNALVTPSTASSASSTRPSATASPSASATPSATPKPTTTTARPTTAAPATTEPPPAAPEPPPTAPATTEPPPAPTWNLVFADEFSAGTGQWSVLSTTVSDLSCASPDNATVDSGVLTLRATQAAVNCDGLDRTFAGAHLAGGSYTYGAVEVRAQGPGTAGTALGVFLSGAGRIDVVSSLGAGLHTYRVEWEPGVIRWYVDGAQVSTQDTSLASALSLHLTVSVTDAAATVPADYQLDYVHVYQR